MRIAAHKVEQCYRALTWMTPKSLKLLPIPSILSELTVPTSGNKALLRLGSAGEGKVANDLPRYCRKTRISGYDTSYLLQMPRLRDCDSPALQCLIHPSESSGSALISGAKERSLKPMNKAPGNALIFGCPLHQRNLP